MSEFTQLKQKRIDQIEVGDIVRSAHGEYQTIKNWSEVISVEVDEEMPATTVKVYRPRTNDGKVADVFGMMTTKSGRTHAQTQTMILPSFDLVDVQRTVDRFGVGVS